jgi:hypothetical protein
MSTIININISISKESSVHRRIATAMEYNAIVSSRNPRFFESAMGSGLQPVLDWNTRSAFRSH